MKREDLQKIEGLSKEQIESIMNLHQVDAEQHKKDLEAKDTQIRTKEAKITELSETVKKFDGVNVSELQQEVKDWEKKYGEDMAAAKKDAAVRLAITKANPRNEKALMALLDLDIVKVGDDDSLVGLSEQLEKIKTENDYLFEPTKQEPESVKLDGAHGTAAATESGITWDGALEEYYNKK